MKKFAYVLLFLLVTIMSLNIGCNNVSKQKYYSDIGFIESKFPEIKGIKSVKFSYIVGDTRSIGLVPVKFEGIININENYKKKIYNKYNWEIVEVEVPHSLWDKECGFLYSEKFDSMIHTDSFVGEFYFCKECGILYFRGEY